MTMNKALHLRDNRQTICIKKKKKEEDTPAFEDCIDATI